jgi:hypothetical protein
MSVPVLHAGRGGEVPSRATKMRRQELLASLRAEGDLSMSARR